MAVGRGRQVDDDDSARAPDKARKDVGGVSAAAAAAGKLFRRLEGAFLAAERRHPGRE